MSIKRSPNGWDIRRKPVHPGEMLREKFLIPLGLSAKPPGSQQENGLLTIFTRVRSMQHN